MYFYIFLSLQESDKGHSHPMLTWDCMPASGGSQLHTHFHGFLGRGHKGPFTNYVDRWEGVRGLMKWLVEQTFTPDMS